VLAPLRMFRAATLTRDLYPAAMDLLILGGTLFLGRHVAEAALERGHRVTLFNRGQSNAELFPFAEKLRGDRDGDHALLRGRRFDAVIDCSGYRPAQVLAAARAVEKSIGHYVFVSSVSVYRQFPPGRRFDENAELAVGDDGYGALKARCEDVLAAQLPGRIAVVRPGLIVGPHDPAERFVYWPRRVAEGGTFLAPGRPDRPVQFIDVRDLAQWSLHLAERRVAGRFNAVGPERTLTMQRLIDGCCAVGGASAQARWIPDESLVAAGVLPWSEMPLWIPESDRQFGGMLLADNRAAAAAGLCFRPLAETIEATLAWDRTRDPASFGQALLSRAREAALIAQLTQR